MDPTVSPDTSERSVGVTHLVDPDWLPVQLDLVHDPARVLGILLSQKLAEPEPLVSLRDTILGEMDVDCRREQGPRTAVMVSSRDREGREPGESSTYRQGQPVRRTKVDMGQYHPTSLDMIRRAYLEHQLPY